MDIFKTYKQLIADQLDPMTVDSAKELKLHGKSITFFRPYLSRYMKDTGKSFQTKKHESEYFIKRVS